MNLAEIIAGIEASDTTLCIVAKHPWTCESDAKLVSLTEQFRVPAEVLSDGYAYFHEVHTAIGEVLGNRSGQLSDAQLGMLCKRMATGMNSANLRL